MSKVHNKLHNVMNIPSITTSHPNHGYLGLHLSCGGSREEINTIYQNLQGIKELKTYPLAGHENYLNKYKQQWVSDVDSFLTGN